MPQIVVEQIVKVAKVIPQERVPERTVEQIVNVPVITEQLTPEVPQIKRLRRAVHVPVEIPQLRVQQRTVEFEHQSQLTLAFTQKDLEYETSEVSEKSAALSQAKADSDDAMNELSPTREHFDCTGNPVVEGTSPTTDSRANRGLDLSSEDRAFVNPTSTR